MNHHFSTHSASVSGFERTFTNPVSELFTKTTDVFNMKETHLKMTQRKKEKKNLHFGVETHLTDLNIFC